MKIAVLIFFVAALTLSASLVVLGALASAIFGGGFGVFAGGVSQKLLVLLAVLIALFLILLLAALPRRQKRST